MAFDKINVTNATINVLATAIQDDSKDTLAKLTEAYAYLSPLIGVEDGDVIDPDDMEELRQYVGNGVSVMLNDGDCIALRVDQNAIQFGVQAPGVETTSYVTLVDSGGVVQTTELKDVSGAYSWSVDEVAGSIASQTQTATVFSRLSGICAKSDVTQADIAAAFSDVGVELPPDMQGLRTSLLNLGAQTSSAGVLTMLQASYSSLQDAREENNTIEFAENKFFVKSFCGSVVKDFLVSAASILGTILIASGGIVGKIAGVALVGIGFVGNAISTAMNASTGALATYNPEASQYEFAQRLFKGTTSAGNLHSNIREAVSEYGVALLRYPGFNLYIWHNPDVEYYQYEAYASLMLDHIPTNNDENGAPLPFRFGGSAANKALYAAVDVRVPNGATHPYRGAYCFLDASSYYGPDNGTYSQWMNDPSDEEMRRRVTVSMIMAAWTLLNVYQYSIGGTYSEEVQTTGFIVFDKDHLDFAFGPIIYTFLYENKIPTWKEIVNDFVPSLQVLHDNLNYNAREIALFSGTDNAGLISLDASISSCPTFRNSYLVTPPNFTPGAILKAVAVTLGAAAVATAAFFTTKALVTKKITVASTKRFANVQASRESWLTSRGTKDEDKALKKYLRDVRKYNKFANLCGLGTISAVDGYISGGSGSVTSSDTTELKDLLDTLYSRIVG